jgi:hypothetical protein
VPANTRFSQCTALYLHLVPRFRINELHFQFPICPHGMYSDNYTFTTQVKKGMPVISPQLFLSCKSPHCNLS